jgi:hypothetical protein
MIRNKFYNQIYIKEFFYELLEQYDYLKIIGNTMLATLKGLIVALLFSGIILGTVFMGYPYKNNLSKEIIIYFFAPFLFIGLLIGFWGGVLSVNRYKKLFLIGILLVYLIALFYGSMIIFQNGNNFINSKEAWLDVLKLGSTSFLLSGVVSIPLLALVVFLTELWTYKKNY